MNNRPAVAMSRGSTSRLSNPVYFFGMALGWSWLFWGVIILSGVSFETPLGIGFGMLGLLGPMLAGLVSVYATGDKAIRRDYWQRVIDGRRIGARWYAVIFLIVPLIFVLSVGLDRLSGGSGGAWEATALRIFAAPWMIIPFALSTILVGPVEEFGWRGYVLDRLQERWSALVASLILGVIWSLWHLPLFFIKDSYQYNLGAGSLSFWLFMIGIVPLTVVFTWVFNNTGRSTLAAMLLHFMVNFTGELVEFTPRAELYSILLWTVVAIVVVALWGAGAVKPRGSHVQAVPPGRYAG